MYINPLKPSGHYMYRLFNIQQFHVLPIQYIYMFCVDLRTNSDYFSTGCSNRDVERESAVRTGSLYIIRINFSLQAVPIAGLSLRRPGFDLGPFHVISEAEKVAMVHICSEFFGFCRSVVCHQCSMLIL